jgi:hypothetical protein
MDRALNLKLSQNILEKILKTPQLNEYDFKFQMGKIKFSTSDSFREGHSLTGAIDVRANDDKIRVEIFASLSGKDIGFKSLSKNWIADVTLERSTDFIIDALDEAKLEAQLLSEKLEIESLNPYARSRLASLKLRLTNLKNQ